MTVAHVGENLSREIRKLGFLRDNLRILLAWPIAAALLIAVIWGVYVYQRNDAIQTLRKNGAVEASALAKAYARQLARTLDHIDQITLNIRYQWKKTGGSLKLEDQVDEGLYPASALLHVTVIDRRGKIKTSTMPRNERAMLAAELKNFQPHPDSHADQLLIINPPSSIGKDQRLIRFSRQLPIKDGDIGGFVIVSVEPAYLVAFHPESALGKSGFLSVRNLDGRLLATQRGSQAGSLNSLFSSEPTFPAGSGVLSMSKDNFSDLEPRIVAWQSVSNFPLVSIAGLSETEMFLPLYTVPYSSRTMALVRTAVVLAFMLIGMLLSARLALRKHQAMQARVASGITADGGNEGFFMWRALRNRLGDVIDFTITDCNEHGASLYGVMKGELLGRKLSSLYQNQDYFQQLMRTYVSTMNTGFYEDDFRIPPQSPLKMTWLHRKMMRSNTGLVLTLRDISDSKAHEAELSNMANSDALTALPNRHWLMGFLPQAIENARASHHKLALLFVDLDDFKNINDTMGHAAGDELLQAAAARLRSVIRPADNVVRLGGDEFTVILERPENVATVERVSERIIAALRQPFMLDDSSSHVVQASVGISLFPQDGEDAATLLKHADIAMYAAKANGKGSYQFFQPQLSQNLIVRLNNEHALRAALDDDQFILHFQPRVDACSGELLSMEALVRWQHPERGMVPPDEFIPLAEETGLIVKLGEMVISKTCMQLDAWRSENLPLVPVSVNVSPRQFNNGNIEVLLSLHMKRHGIEARLVEVELTESCMMGEDQIISAQLDAIKSLGVKLLIDDFGTGYSSLSQLQRLDLDVLKIDKAFTSQLGKGKEGEVFFKAIISMAQVLNISVVAEGVETLQQLHMLQALSCNEVQGYYVSRPLPAAQAAQLLRKRFLFPAEAIALPLVC